jgi:hypothetical protein
VIGCDHMPVPLILVGADLQRHRDTGDIKVGCAACGAFFWHRGLAPSEIEAIRTIARKHLPRMHLRVVDGGRERSPKRRVFLFLVRGGVR